METILYQGGKVRVRIITEINVRRGEGMDFLLRDGKGRYYFRRETYDVEGLYLARRKPEASNYRCRVHRVSLRTAVLFQVAFAADRQLRADTARLLEGDGRGRKSAPGKLIVELDDLASAMLRRACREGTSCREAGEDPRDLVNAAVTFYLCGDDDSRRGDFDLEDGGDALERAKNDRQTREKEAV